MSRRAVPLISVLLSAGAVLVSLSRGSPPVQVPPPKPVPKLEPVAETRLLMEGLNQSNMRGLKKLLAQKPADRESWVFVRGQALLIAETGNLLVLRPPKTGEDIWMSRATDMRAAGASLARAAAARDYEQSRTRLIRLAETCNQCHKSFRVSTRIVPFEEPNENP